MVNICVKKGISERGISANFRPVRAGGTIKGQLLVRVGKNNLQVKS